MTNIKAFGQFSPFSVGFDDIFSTLQRASIPSSNYPPYDILKEAISDTDDKYIIRIAIAGFKKSEVDIEIKSFTNRLLLQNMWKLKKLQCLMVFYKLY
jgi:HSP20 family molecular chaperone IbpA